MKILMLLSFQIGEEGELEQLEKFNAIKASKPENVAVEMENTMEFDAEVVAESY